MKNSDFIHKISPLITDKKKDSQQYPNTPRHNQNISVSQLEKSQKQASMNKSIRKEGNSHQKCIQSRESSVKKEGESSLQALSTQKEIEKRRESLKNQYS